MFHLGGLYSIVNPDLIDQFDTYLGGFGVEYGDKLGGAINVQTKDPRSDLTEHSAQIGFFDSSYRVEGPISENSSGYFAVRRSYLDLFIPATGSLGTSDINYTQFPQFWDLQAKWQYRLANGFVDFNILTSNDKLTLNVDNRVDILQDPAIAGYLGGEDAFQTYGIRWHQNLNNNWEQKIHLGLLNTSSDRFIGSQLDGEPSPGSPYTKKVKGENWFLLPQWEYSCGIDYNLKTGLDAYSYNYDINGYWYQPCQEGLPDCNLTRLEKGSLDETITESELSPYMEYQQDITDKLALTFGLRNSNITLKNNNLNAVSPRVSVEYEWSEDLILTAHWGKFVQKPEISQLVDNLGNPTLNLSEAEHRIIGAKGEAKGFVLFLKREYKNGSFGWISYGYSDSRRTDLPGSEERPFDGDQPHTLSAVWSQPMPGSCDKWRWGMKMNASTGQPYTKVISRTSVPIPDGSGDSYWVPTYGEINGDRLPFYFRADLSMERDWKYRDIDLTTRFELINVNALFRQNVVGYLYNSDYSEVEEIYDLPFLPSFSIRGTF